ALDKLGSSYWQARKAKVKERLLDIANDLLKIAAERALKPGEVMPPPPSFTEFCARFPYAETEDQERAIIDTLGDLTSGKPMDRLICGDVGFGKTEVALRASYIAAGQGFQVAVVVPTTLLARQHYQTFSNRFAGTNLRIGQLSRLVGTSEAKQLKESISKHEVDIVIGTHALLSDAVKFANLGLLVIDEEQHFGVKQKERLKELRANVHVLTLTATPIPRTLQLALTGVKDLSLIASPPVDRLAVHTYVLPFDPVVIKEALLRERQRGGQSFYVCPRLADLPKIQETLRELTPELKSRTAHGQMAPSDLDQTMTDFYERKFDILISTNIVESGLDIPNANTLIIHRADMFGLAQLYQLRGRVGRSKTRAYAYLTLSERKQITADAERRLQVMQTLDHLGAGFTLASHDMDIRGSGNLLGDEQSGHIREVGIELYQQLLQEAVAAAREHKSNAVESEPFSPQINLGLPVMIPESYVADLSLRLSLYRRLSTLKTDTDIQSFAAELHDRFGKLPPEVENLLLVVSLKNLCLQAGIDKLDMGPKGAVIGFYKNRFAAPDKLIAYIQRQAGTMKLRPDNKIVVLRAFAEEDKGRFKIIQTVLFEIAGLLK
ncbi:MAG: DEAD/DEAH box helicase, partial [Dongiaceae bacterium]